MRAVLALVALLLAQIPFRSGVDLTSFAATVTDRKGNVVTDLTKDDFEILEDGKKQTLEYFAVGDGDAAPPMHLGLMLDASGSMQTDMKLAQGAAIKFLNMLPAARDITLVDFDTQVRITTYPQADFARLIERIRQRKPDGWTALYDALGTYLDGADGLDGRKVMVMYTDGMDSKSAISFSETLTLLKASNVTVYAIGLVQNTGSYRQVLQMTLRQLTEVTGGQAFFPSEMKDVESAYDKVLAEIKGQYHLGYQSTNTVRDGAWRKVEIRLKRSDLRIRSRKGYYGPYKPASLSSGTMVSYCRRHPCPPSLASSTSHPTSSFAATRSMPYRSWSKG
jgi:Ca-activated chloride channel family protein